MIAEEWRPVAGYEGSYSVSSHGRVRGEERISPRGRRLQGRMLRPAPSNGYRTVSLYRQRRRTHFIHALVAAAFLGPRPEGWQVCHADGSRDNNRLDNLRWGTRSDNAADMIAHGRSQQGARHALAKLTSCDVREIRARISRGERGADIASRYGVTHSNISSIKVRRSWAWLDDE